VVVSLLLPGVVLLVDLVVVDELLLHALALAPAKMAQEARSSIRWQRLCGSPRQVSGLAASWTPSGSPPPRQLPATAPTTAPAGAAPMRAAMPVAYVARSEVPLTARSVPLCCPFSAGVAHIR
jgi:hypothetical protein